jgi:xanthine dehydrogenase accessory factor
VPAPRLLVVGETPIAGAVMRMAPELGLDAVLLEEGVAPRAGDLGLVVAAHGRDEAGALRRGLELGLPYVGLVASRARGDGVLGELRGDGVAPELLERIEVPAGLEIGARTPAEIALSILARVVEVRRGKPAKAAATAVDPICGMTVAAIPSTLSLQHDGETVYFCCEGCKAEFERQHQHAAAD